MPTTRTRTLSHRATAAIMTLAVLAATLPASILPATALAATGVKREAGASIYETSAIIGRRHFRSPVSVAYIVGTKGMAHALVAGAAAKRRGPVLVVGRDSIPFSVRRTLDLLDPGRIVVVGSSDYVSGKVVAQLDNFTTGVVKREAGSDVFDTSAVISRRHFQPGVKVVYIANGNSGLAEGIAGGAVAAKLGGPLLFVHRDGFSAKVRDELLRLDPVTIRVLGSTSHVSSTVFNRLQNFTDGSVRREVGASVYETSAIVSRKHYAAGVRVAYIVSPSGLAHAMGVDAAAGRLKAPVLLVGRSSIPSSVRRELERLDPEQILVVGDSTYISGAVVTALEAYVSRPPVAVDDNLGTVVSECPMDRMVLANDSDANDPFASLQVTAASDPAHGTATILNTLHSGITAPRAIRYVSDNGYTGADSFTYTVTDPHGDSDQATVSVNVAASGGNDDGDGLPNECDPFAGAGAFVPFALGFDGGDGGVVDSGFTGLMTNSRLGSLLDGDVGLSGGALVNPTVDAGDANDAFNSQRNALQAGIATPSQTFRIDGTVCGPFPTEVGAGVGIYFGRGDQDNFIKAIVTWNATRHTYAVQDYREVFGDGSGIAKKSDPNIGSAQCVTVYLTVDPTTGKYAPSYSLDGGPRTGFGGDSSRRTVPHNWLDGPTFAAGVVATSRGAAPVFQATWKAFHVVVP